MIAGLTQPGETLFVEQVDVAGWADADGNRIVEPVRDAHLAVISRTVLGCGHVRVSCHRPGGGRVDVTVGLRDGQSCYCGALPEQVRSTPVVTGSTR